MRTTNASSSIRFDHNQHGNVASESVAVFPHLTYHRAHAFTLVERLKPNKCRKQINKRKTHKPRRDSISENSKKKVKS